MHRWMSPALVAGSLLALGFVGWNLVLAQQEPPASKGDERTRPKGDEGTRPNGNGRTANIVRQGFPAAKADPEDPTKFFIYEQYVNEAAYTAHTETEHFQRLGFGDAIPRLLERKREFYAPMVD